MGTYADFESTKHEDPLQNPNEKKILEENLCLFIKKEIKDITAYPEEENPYPHGKGEQIPSRGKMFIGS